MRPPQFWLTGGAPAAMLGPLEMVTRVLTARRVARPGWHAPVPVICCGNASVGGTGKTPLCIDIAGRLRARGVDAHILTRGYGGGARRIKRVDATRDAAGEVGDEAMLLAAVAPTWVGADRAGAARQAVAAGAAALIMDDGLQHPSLHITCGLLVIDGGAGFGNGRLLPAGPLREPVQQAASRCVAAVLIGEDAAGAAAALPETLPLLRARLSPGADMLDLAGREVLAFAGIGRPEKFFASLRQAGIVVRDSVSFADHYRYRTGDLRRLRQAAAAMDVPLVTTWKDHVRLPAADRPGILRAGIALQWDDAAARDGLLARAVP
jgi:tetraacyldisaccharide 4'-kinase